MFGIDGPELLVIIIVLIVIVGPKDLPKVMHVFGKAMARARVVTQEFLNQFDEVLREANIHDLTDVLHKVQKSESDLHQSLKQNIDSFHPITQNRDSYKQDAVTLRLTPSSNGVSVQESTDKMTSPAVSKEKNEYNHEEEDDNEKNGRNRSERF